jgi:hypothetical protein
LGVCTAVLKWANTVISAPTDEAGRWVYCVLCFMGGLILKAFINFSKFSIIV